MSALPAIPHQHTVDRVPFIGPRIEDHGLLGDQRGSALVRRDGSIVWLCMPRFDDAAVFAGLLGTEQHGFWQIAPTVLMDGAAIPASSRQYAGNSLILQTTWSHGTASAVVSDFMVPGGGTPRLVRVVTGLSGAMAMRSLLRARPDYGSIVPRIVEFDGRHAIDLPERDGGRLWLDAAVPVHVDRADLVSEFTVTAGQTVAFGLSWREGVDSPPPVPADDALLKFTLDFWEAWAERCTYAGPDREAVVRSLLTLGALIYAPTGAIVAAPTTSLPEEIGGIRNYDYRYAWLRDGALTAGVLRKYGYLREALAWVCWAVHASHGQGGGRSCSGSAVRGSCRRGSWAGCRDTRGPRRSASATPQRTSSRSTSTANSPSSFTASPRRTAAGPGGSVRSSSRSPRSWSRSGTGPTRASGRCAGRSATSPIPRSWPGPPSTGPSAPSRPATPTGRWSGGGAARDDPRRGVREGLRRRPQLLHPVVRVAGAGCLAPARHARGFPAR